MKYWKRVTAVLILLCLVGVAAGVGLWGFQNRQPLSENALVNKETLYLWYTDEALEDYIASVSLEFSEKEDVRVIPVLTTGLEYLERINEESLQKNVCPDVFIIGNDSLEKAYLAGLAVPIKDEDGFVGEEHFPDAAVRAVTYRNKIIGYPLYYETSALVYNKTYMRSLAESQIQAQLDAAEGEAAMAALDENGEPPAEEGTAAADASKTDASEAAGGIDEAEVENRMAALIPATVDDILTFADSYDAPQQVEAVFKWDVADIFYNYFFVGNYIDVGGPAGDNTESISIYNLDAVKCLMAYQNLNQFFSIAPDEVDYDSVIQEFIDGKLVFTVGTTDVIARIEQAKKEGKFEYEYGVTTLPKITEELATRSLSVTNAVVVNGYSKKQELANRFASYLSNHCADKLYEKTGRLPARKDVAFDNPAMDGFTKEYEMSVPIPKMMAASNYWVQMEIAFTKIWSGEEASATLKALSEQILTQVTGQPVEETYIEPPEEETQSVEYQD